MNKKQNQITKQKERPVARRTQSKRVSILQTELHPSPLF